MTLLLCFLDELPILNGLSELEESASNDSSPLSPLFDTLECAVCNQTFDARDELNTHILEHVKQPKIILQRVEIPKPEKLEKRSFARKHIRPYKNLISQVIEQERPPGSIEEYPLVPKIRILLPQQLSDQVDAREIKRKLDCESAKADSAQNKLDEELNDSKHELKTENIKMVELQTLPNESQSPSFPGQSPGQPDMSMHQSNDSSNFWGQDDTPVTNQSPLRHQESGEKEAERHDSLLQNFLNDSADNVVSSKDQGMIIPSHETEFISLDRLAGPQCSVCGERYVDQSAYEMHCKATGHYPSNSLVPYGQTAMVSQQHSQHSQLSSQLDSLTNLPMQQLAQQVNRLQQQGQVHQQNVLINIQQFGQPMAPPPPPYGGGEMPPHMHHMPHYPTQPNQHMYMPHASQYHPGPPHHMYYQGGGSGGGMFPPQHHQPPQQPPQQAQPRPQYHHREPSAMMPPRMPPPRVPPPHVRPQQHHVRGPQISRGGGAPRGRGAPGPPPRAMPGPQQASGRGVPNQQQQRIILQKRNAPQEQQQIKKKRMDMLIPDTNDDADCHVISMQKCNDGLPIIKNVQGAATSTADGLDPVVHLTDSITLSVRNPKEVAPVTQQKKNDAKAVANILATRGITVTPATKSQKEVAATITSKPTPAPVAINLNSAVSIIPTARNQQGAKPNGANSDRPRPPTVDLTDDEPAPQKNAPQGTPGVKRALPHQCDLCPAQYPNMRTLVIHRRQYHKAGPQSELGVPIVDLSQPAVLSKLASLGIHSYIPLPQTGSGPNATFALPIVSVNAARNPNVCNINALGSGAVLTLGPLHHISNLPNKQ